MTPGTLNYWAAMLKDESPGVTVHNPPAYHFFDASGSRAAPPAQATRLSTPGPPRD
jgi:hypothetical protein